MTQDIIITIILAACITYAAIRIYKALHQAYTCKNYRCSGCAFYEKCKKNKKKLPKNLVE